jgi:hypothetical protein
MACALQLTNKASDPLAIPEVRCKEIRTSSF